MISTVAHFPFFLPSGLSSSELFFSSDFFFSIHRSNTFLATSAMKLFIHHYYSPTINLLGLLKSLMQFEALTYGHQISSYPWIRKYIQERMQKTIYLCVTKIHDFPIKPKFWWNSCIYNHCRGNQIPFSQNQFSCYFSTIFLKITQQNG